MLIAAGVSEAAGCFRIEGGTAIHVDTSAIWECETGPEATRT